MWIQSLVFRISIPESDDVWAGLDQTLQVSGDPIGDPDTSGLKVP